MARTTTTTTTTAFVTGATGLIGTALVRVLVARGHRVYGLTRSVEAAQRVRRAGAVPVMGNLLEPGLWQDVAAADWVFHLPPPSACGLYVTNRAAGTMSEERVSMDRHLLDALSGVATRRIVYAASAGAYGATGPIPVTEDAPPRPSAWGRTLAPALDRLDGYLVTGLPIVTALPGWVYGNGSWFRARVLEPILAGRPVLQIGTPGPWVSPIHVTDCARALTHLAERGAVGGRYFLVNDEAIRATDFASEFARIANRPLRVRRLPAVAIRLAGGSVSADYFRADGLFSNIRLRGLGFRFEYPTLEAGLQEVLRALHE